MENPFENNFDRNPLRDLISDDVYELLSLRGLFNETSVRDRAIRMKFKF